MLVLLQVPRLCASRDGGGPSNVGEGTETTETIGCSENGEAKTERSTTLSPRAPARGWTPAPG